MKLSAFQQLLQAHADKQFRLVLPGDNPVPVSFHITEVGYVSKTFIDCGGKVHSQQTCQLQAWVGADADHRIVAGKMADIMGRAHTILPEGSDLDVEIEYEASALSQYPIRRGDVQGDALVFTLDAKHTDCLAKELCVLPVSASACCGTGCGC